ncbi:MAG TPA: M28 family peptidase [Puia sp.]|nr:M28 family peptidase [Puia sp.]
MANLQTHIRSLSADTAGGRVMGSSGEKSTGDYVISELSKTGARPKGDNNGWLQKFTIDEGRQIADNALFTIDDHALVAGKEWFPLSLSPAGEVAGSPAIALQESGVPWFQDIREWLEPGAGASAGADNPHADLIAAIRAKAAACVKKGATALILYNSAGHLPDKLVFDPKDKPEPAAIPVVYITRETKRKYLKDESASVDIRLRIAYTEKRESGSNVVAFLDNGAATTVVIGSRYDNSSGLAAMIELARMLGASKWKSDNYLFVVFSGSPTARPGSDFYAGHPAIDPKKTGYFLELGRLDDFNDTMRTVFIGGKVDAPGWPVIRHAPHEKKAIAVEHDNSSAGPGDREAFYRRQIPVLVVSTRPATAADADDPVNYEGELQVVKFIYAMIEEAGTRRRLPFTP